MRGFHKSFLALVGTAFCIVPAIGASFAVAAEAPGTLQPPVEPDSYRSDEYRKPVPATLKGAVVLTSVQASAIWAGRAAVFVDVYPHAPKPDNLPANTLWREPVHQTIERAVWLPNTGYGVLSPATEAYFKSHLERLTGGDTSKPLVFFCLRNCWMSWNAARRAISYGYSQVHWYPDGSDGWQEIGQLVVDVKPEP